MSEPVGHTAAAISEIVQALMDDVVATVRKEQQYADIVNSLADQSLRALLNNL